MDAERRKIARLVKRLREAVERNEFERFDAELGAGKSKALLVGLREQKVLPKASAEMQPLVAQSLQRAAASVLDAEGAKAFERYLGFIEIWAQVHRAAQDRLNLVGKLPVALEQRQLLFLFDEACDAIIRGHLVELDPRGLTVGEYERRLHTLNGLINDTVYAALRGLNEVAKGQRNRTALRISKSQRDHVRRRLKKTIEIAAEVNALESLLDWVSYGDLVVSSMTPGKPPTIRFDYADPRLSLLRTLAIRRKFIVRMNRAGSEKYIRRMLQASAQGVLAESFSYFCEWAGLEEDEAVLDRVQKAGADLLIHVDAEDDLLAIAAGNDARTASHYLTAASLHWHQIAARVLRETLPRGQRWKLTAPIVPTSNIAAAIRAGGGVEVNEAIEALSSQLPARSHYDLMRRPFIRAREGDLVSLGIGDGGLWSATVRETLIAGGKLGDAYGKAFELFYEWSFKDSDWQVLGRGLKLRRGGKAATDLDLLLKREDLLLVVQIKALIGSGLSIYDHWRNRQTIEWGCRQANEAVAFIESQPDWLVAVAGRKAADGVQRIQGTVLTNLATFDGWKFHNIPVIGETGRKAITEGAKVDYVDPDGATVATHWITRPDERTTERILWSLDHPIEFEIAPEGFDTWRQTIEVPGLIVELPQFVLREPTTGHPATIGITAEPAEAGKLELPANN